MMCDMLPEELLRTKSKGTKLEEEGDSQDGHTQLQQEMKKPRCRLTRAFLSDDEKTDSRDGKQVQAMREPRRLKLQPDRTNCFLWNKETAVDLEGRGQVISLVSDPGSQPQGPLGRSADECETQEKALDRRGDKEVICKNGKMNPRKQLQSSEGTVQCENKTEQMAFSVPQYLRKVQIKITT